MSELIVEMEMPCNIQYLAGLHGTPTCPIKKRMCKDANNPPKWCPIKGELPDEHGDLIDADTVLWEEEVPDSEGIVVPVTIGDVIEGYDVQIVIAAERKDDEQIH